MIIKRQKLFTRGEKRALRELYKATKGFRHMPTGRGVRYTPRDVYRFDQLALSLNKWREGQKLSPEEITEMKTFLNHSGLNKSSDQLEKVLGKYTNKKALIRLNRMKEANIDSTNQQLEKLRKRSYARAKKDVKEYKSSLGINRARLEGNRKDIKRFRKISPCYEKWKNRYDIGEVRVGKNYTNACAVPTSTLATTRRREVWGDMSFKNDLISDISPNRKIDPSKIDLNRKGGNIFIGGKDTSNVPQVPPEIAFHELGHIAASSEPIGRNILDEGWKYHRTGKSFYKPGRKFLCNGRESMMEGMDGLLKVAAENRASSKALSMMREGGMPEQDLIRSKKNLGKALNTYTSSSQASLWLNMMDRIGKSIK